MFLACLAVQAAPINLDELRWKRRVIVIHAPAGTEKTLRAQEQLLRKAKTGLAERDLTEIVLRAPGDHPQIARRFELTGSEFTFLLLGKDGGEKLRSHEVVEPEKLFRLIDAMPMRRDEMRQGR